MENETRWEEHTHLVPVWDLPTRLFHWLLVVLVAAAFATAKAGGNAMIYHEWCGSAVLALLLFRLVWGMVGSGPSRFASTLPAAHAGARNLEALDHVVNVHRLHLKGLLHTGFALQYFNHMQAKPAVHQARQNTNFLVPE